jgi:hypothetical protein
VSVFPTERVSAGVTWCDSIEKLTGPNLAGLPVVLTCGFVQSHLSR